MTTLHPAPAAVQDGEHFGQRLHAEAVDQWAEFYVNYESLKRLMGQAQTAIQNGNVDGTIEFDETFRASVRRDLSVAEEHLCILMSELYARYESIKRAAKSRRMNPNGSSGSRDMMGGVGDRSATAMGDFGGVAAMAASMDGFDASGRGGGAGGLHNTRSHGADHFPTFDDNDSGGYRTPGSALHPAGQHTPQRGSVSGAGLALGGGQGAPKHGGSLAELGTHDSIDSGERRAGSAAEAASAGTAEPVLMRAHSGPGSLSRHDVVGGGSGFPDQPIVTFIDPKGAPHGAAATSASPLLPSQLHRPSMMSVRSGGHASTDFARSYLRRRGKNTPGGKVTPGSQPIGGAASRGPGSLVPGGANNSAIVSVQNNSLDEALLSRSGNNILPGGGIAANGSRVGPLTPLKAPQAPMKRGLSTSFFHAMGDSRQRRHDDEFSEFLQLYTTCLKTLRFAELNVLAVERASGKWDKRVLAPLVEKVQLQQQNQITSRDRLGINHGDDHGAAASGGGGVGTDPRREQALKSMVDFSDALIKANALYVRQTELRTFIRRIKEHTKSRFDEGIDGFAAVDGSFSQSWTIKWRWVFFAFILMFVAMLVPVLPNAPMAHQCAAMLCAVVVLWVTEAIPFFTTAMLIPLLAVPMHVIPGDRAAIGVKLLSVTFDHVQILVLGGLCMGKALAKHKLEGKAARFLLRYTAHRPKLYFLCVMMAGAIACAFISNVAAPLLVLNVVQRTLWELPEDSGAPQALLLGLAFACNFGGMLTPIASPQNAVAVKDMSPDTVSFYGWFAATAPVVFPGIFITWGLLLVLWKPFDNVPYIPVPLDDDEGEKPMDRFEVGVVLVVCVVTVILWCVPVDVTLGDNGVIALIPIVVFFGLGILKKDDFNTLSWHLLFLLAGGNMLGVCAQESGLLTEVVSSLEPFLQSHGRYSVIAVLIVATALVTTFVSHTVASLILMPVVNRIARASTELPAAPALSCLCVLMCSGSMAFPITSFPNVNSLLAEDEQGQPYLRAKDFLFPGLILSTCVLVMLMSYEIPLTVALLLSTSSPATTAAPWTTSMAPGVNASVP